MKDISSQIEPAESTSLPHDQTTPMRRKAAIRALEEAMEEDGEEDLIEGVLIFESDIKAADCFMAMTRPSAQSVYLREKISRSRHT